MLRIKGASKENASEEARRVFEEQEKQFGSILNTAKVYGLRPSIQKGVQALQAGILESGLISGDLRHILCMGERIIVVGRVLDEDERLVPKTLIEIWQANAAGRYHHPIDQHNAPLDPNFTGAGRCVTNDEGEYRYLTIKPGAYPWLNHTNAWRPAHIHLSLFGPSFVTRLVTQMFFPNDPLLPLDPILSSVPSKDGRQRLISSYDHNITEPEFALGYRFDIVLRGRRATPFEEAR